LVGTVGGKIRVKTEGGGEGEKKTGKEGGQTGKWGVKLGDEAAQCDERKRHVRHQRGKRSGGLGLRTWGEREGAGKG